MARNSVMNQPTPRAFAAVSALLFLAGCAGWGGPVTQAAGPAGAAPAQATPEVREVVCDAKPVQGVVGQSSTASVTESARVRANAQVVRILRPGQVVTKEFYAQRLNLSVDGSGRILAVHCG